MLKDLIKQSWLSQEDIVSQIKNEYDIGYAFAEPIRQEFDKETKLFNYQKKNKKKLGDSTLFNVHSAMMAREYVDRPTSKFDWTIWQRQIVTNLNAALDVDFNDSYMENIIYDWKHDKFLRGAGILIRNGWDWTNKRPTFDLIDPRLAILDPDWDYRNWDYGYFGFEKLEYWNNLENWKWFEDLSNVNKNSNTWNAAALKEKDQQNFKLNAKRNNNLSNPSVETYYHFSVFGWVRAMVITSNIRTEIIKVIIYKENNKVKMFDDVLAITYRRPRKNNPFWDRMSRYVWDVQIAKSMIANLRFDKSKAELYPMYLRNTRLIKNKWDLDFGFGKVVDATPLEWESLANAVAPIQRDVRADNSFVIDDSLDRQVESSTSIWKIAQWTTPERREAATTNRLVQDSTDINLAFTWKIDAIWYERLLKVWYFGYMEELWTWDKKLIFIQTWYGTISREIKRNDFLTDSVLKIKIETKSEIDTKNIKDRVAYWQLIWYLQSIPNRPETAQLNTMRNYARAMDMWEDIIKQELPATSQEIIAQINIWLLLDWQFVDVKQDYEADTHLTMLQSAWNWDNVEMYKYQLLELKKIQWIPQAPVEQNQGVANNLVAQSSANAMNEATQINNL